MKPSGLIALARLEARHRAWLASGDRPVLGERHLAILEAVREAGSLNAAAKQLRISYRDAWQKIRHAEAALGVGLIAAQVGGRHGGGSRLTAAGEEVIARLRLFLQEQGRAAVRCATWYFGGEKKIRSRHKSDSLVLATTTSVVDSGLLPALLAPFMRRMGIDVEMISVGTGAALRLAHAGRADVVLAHAPEAEARALAAADVLDRHRVMTNEFVLVGPRDDPADARRARAMHTALRRIAATHAPFLSRGDGSGTHLCERALFAAAGVQPDAWYRRARAGMAEVLRRADAAGAYTLTDRGTFAALADGLSLDVMCADGSELTNAYSVLATNPHRHPEANYVAAMALIGWLTSPAAQELIAAYRVAGRLVAQPAAASGRAGRAPARHKRRSA